MRLFVGNLPYSVGNDDLQRAFSEAGTVVSARVITDRESGQSRGFGFVEMSSAGEGRWSRSGRRQYVAHLVESRWPTGDPRRGPQGTCREGLAALRPVGEFDALPGPEEEDGVVADHVPAAQRHDADLAVGTFADEAVTTVDRVFLQHDAASGGDRAPEGEGGDVPSYVMKPDPECAPAEASATTYL